MAGIDDLSKSKQIRNLLLVIGSAVAVAFAAMFFMLYSYGPAGTYLAKNVLISPENAETLYSNQSYLKKSKAKNNPQLVFDIIEFSYYDSLQKRFKNIQISKADYAKVFKLIENDVSLEDKFTETDFFTNFKQVTATLAFKVRSEESLNPIGLNLFEVDFIKDYYRISLRGQNTEQQWAYFKHTDILERVLELLSNDNKPT